MLNLILDDAVAVVPIIFLVIVFSVVIGVKVVIAKQRQNGAKNSTAYPTQTQQRYNLSQRQNSIGTDCDVHTHVGERAIAQDGHEHIGADEEHYEKIVGSLGEVDDEGCADLDGIRLIAHDAAYEGEDDSRNYSEIVKAMVLGEILENPRFKSRRK